MSDTYRKRTVKNYRKKVYTLERRHNGRDGGEYDWRKNNVPGSCDESETEKENEKQKSFAFSGAEA
jgi:hypothetical protein